MISKLKHGPAVAKVEEVKITWQTLDEIYEKDFLIL